MRAPQVLHQPRLAVFELAHSLLLLDTAGRTVYMGPTRQVRSHFEGLGFPCISAASHLHLGCISAGALLL